MQNTVPSFLVIDQPRQIYFPSDAYERFVSEDGDGDTSARSKDLWRTRQIFKAVAYLHAP